MLFTYKDNDCNLDYALFSPLALSFLLTYTIHPSKISIPRPGPSPLPAAGVLKSFLPSSAGQRSDHTPSCSQLLLIQNFQNSGKSVMTKVIDAKDNIVLHRTKVESYKYIGNTIHATDYQLQHYLHGKTCNKIFYDMIYDMIWYFMTWHDMIGYDIIFYDMI